LSENVIVRDGNFRVFGQDSDTARTSGLAECAKAVNKTNEEAIYKVPQLTVHVRGKTKA
jgi:hypothetical protein